MMWPSSSTATPWGLRNCFACEPSPPRKRAVEKSGSITTSLWLLKSVTMTRLSGAQQTPRGESKCFHMPALFSKPYLQRKFPLWSKSWTRWFLVSETTIRDWKQAKLDIRLMKQPQWPYFGVCCDIPRVVKLAWFGSLLSKFEQKNTFESEDLNAVVVLVSHNDSSQGVDRHSGRSVELTWTASLLSKINYY